MFSLLTDKIDSAFRNLRGVGKITEKNIADALKDVRLALLEADVEYSVAKTFMANVKEKAMGEEVLKSVKPGEQIVKIFHDELALLLGGDQESLSLDAPAHLLIVGLNGAGKTTSSAKLALHLKNQGKKPVLIACDLIRPAAIDQLATLGKQIDVPVFTPHPEEKDVIDVVERAQVWAKEQGADVLIFDTAGRQEVDDSLVAELIHLEHSLSPQETLLVVDAAMGQQSVHVAKAFCEAIELTGLILTKLDGDARGGAALSLRSLTGRPIKFAGEGEKLEQFGPFYPDRMADRILGMGDIVGLVEHAAAKISEKDAMKAAQRMAEGNFDFSDFLGQMKMIQSLGPLEGLLGMLPGFSKIKKQLPEGALDSKKMKHLEAMILSMTLKERKNPDIINASRRQRIAKGSGSSLDEVNKLIKNFNEMRGLMSGKGKMGALMKQMGGMKGLMNGEMPDMSSMPSNMGALMRKAKPTKNFGGIFGKRGRGPF